MKTCYECENCESVTKRKEQIAICPVCKEDICEYCKDQVFCAITRVMGHEDCFIEEQKEYYQPEEHKKKACKNCNLIYCDCERKQSV